MDSQKAANWAQVIGTCIGAALLGYAIWDHWPTSNQSSIGVGWGSTMKGYVPPALIAVILLASSVLQFVLWRRRQARHNKPTLEILSPFDNEEVGLYEIVRGRVFPPNTNLQVLVFAGDKKWYPQPHVDVKGSTWSVKCQFGSLDSPSSGAYKIVAVLGNELSEGMWYRDLPSGSIRSNTIQVNRPEMTIEQELAAAQEDAKKWQRDYHQVNNAATPLKNLNENYEQQIGRLTEDLKIAQSEAKEARREVLAVASNLDGVKTDRNNYRTWYNELAWLNPAIKPQKEDISNYVKVIAARPCVLSLKERVVIIDLVIRNDSFFDITIKPGTVAGQLSTNKKGLLHDPAKAFVDLEHPPIDNLKPTKERMFAIIQPLLRTEAEEIEDAIREGSDGYFWLDRLNIPITVQNAEPLDVDSKPLRMNSDVEHVYFREFGSLTFDGEVITPRELVRDVEALPFPERARIYRELSKAYGESLWRLNEAKEKKDPEELANEAISRNTNNA